MNQRLMIAAFACALSASPLLAGPYEDGVAAYEADDYANAVSLLRPLAEAGNDNAQYYLGAMYEYGDGVPESDEQALTWYRRSADQGDQDAQYRVARFYEKGRGGVEENPQQAFAYYKLAAEQGNWRAQHELGLCYSSGYGVKQSKKLAAQWFEKAAREHDYARSKRELGVLYELGTGVEQDVRRAAELYAEAGDQGDADGRAYLAELYESGNGVRQDQARAVKLYKQAALQGSEYAKKQLDRLGIANDMANDEAYAAYLSRDFKKAVQLWEARVARSPSSAAEARSITASLHNLSMAYKDGTGVSQDISRARGYFERSALNGHAPAQVELGHLYYFGKGVAKDYSLAELWYRRAAEQGDPDGQHNLGIMYQEGLGVPQDDAMAALLYNMAAEQGHAGGLQALAHYDYLEEKARRDEWFRYLTLAAERFAREAQEKKARCTQPIGTASRLYNKFKQTGYRWEWVPPSGC